MFLQRLTRQQGLLRLIWQESLLLVFFFLSQWELLVGRRT